MNKMIIGAGIIVAITLVVMSSQKESDYVFLKNNPEIRKEMQKDCIRRAYEEKDTQVMLERDCFYASNINRYEEEEIENMKKLRETIGKGLPMPKCNDIMRRRGAC